MQVNKKKIKRNQVGFRRNDTLELFEVAYLIRRATTHAVSNTLRRKEKGQRISHSVQNTY